MFNCCCWKMARLAWWSKVFPSLQLHLLIRWQLLQAPHSSNYSTISNSTLMLLVAGGGKGKNTLWLQAFVCYQYFRSIPHDPPNHLTVERYLYNVWVLSPLITIPHFFCSSFFILLTEPWRLNRSGVWERKHKLLRTKYKNYGVYGLAK